MTPGRIDPIVHRQRGAGRRARAPSDRPLGTPVAILSGEPSGGIMGSGLESEFVTLHEIVKAAKAKLTANIWDYLVGGTETETTLRRNRMALDSIAFKPRVLRDVSRIDPSSEIFGKRLR